MTKDETRRVITYIAGAYPKFYSNVTERSLQGQIATWTDLLEEHDVKSVMIGVKGYITADSSGFPPTPGQIIEYMQRVTHPADLTAVAAWSLVRRAVNSPRDQYEAAFASLPEIIQETLGGPERGVAQLKAWGGDGMSIQAFETVEQSNFFRSYEATQKRLAIDRKLPPSFLALRGGTTQRLEGQKAEDAKAPVRAAYEAVEAPSELLSDLKRRLGNG